MTTRRTERVTRTCNINTYGIFVANPKGKKPLQKIQTHEKA